MAFLRSVQQSVIIANVVESRSAGLSQVAPEISRHIFMASPARRAENVQHRIIHSSLFLPVICGLTSLRLHYQAFLLQWQGLKSDCCGRTPAVAQLRSLPQAVSKLYGLGSRNVEV